MMNNIVFCLFGPSGSGKTTWKQFFIKQGFKGIKSFTTRDKRGQQDKEYSFISKEEFQKLLDQNLLTNVNDYYGEWYGILKSDLNTKNPLVMISDRTNLQKLRQEIKNIIFISCYPPKDIYTRLIKRNTPERISIAKKEIQTNIPTDVGDIHILKDEIDALNLIKQYLGKG